MSARHEFDPQAGGHCAGCGRTPGQVRTLEKAGMNAVDVCPQRKPRRPVRPEPRPTDWSPCIGQGMRSRDGSDPSWSFVITGEDKPENDWIRVEFALTLNGAEMHWSTYVPAWMRASAGLVYVIRAQVYGLLAAPQLLTPDDVGILRANAVRADLPDNVVPLRPKP